MQNKIIFFVRDQTLSAIADYIMVAEKAKDYVTAKFIFDDGESPPRDLTQFKAYFYRDNVHPEESVALNSEGECLDPNEVLESSGPVCVFLYSKVTDGNNLTTYRYTTNDSTINVAINNYYKEG